MSRALLVALFVTLVPLYAAAQTTAAKEPAAKKPAAKKPAAEAPLTFDGMLAAGHRLYIEGNPEGALEKYNAAKGMESGNAISYYFIGAAKAKMGRHEEAVAVLRTAATIAAEKDPAVKGKSLFMVAYVLEAAGDMDAANSAWNTYLDFAKTHTDVTAFVPVAQARMDAIAAWKKLKEQYAGVKAKAPAKDAKVATGGTGATSLEVSH